MHWSPRVYGDSYLDGLPPAGNRPVPYWLEAGDISYEVVKKHITSMLGSDAYVTKVENINGTEYIYYSAMVPFTASQKSDLKSYTHEFREAYLSPSFNQRSTPQPKRYHRSNHARENRFPLPPPSEYPDPHSHNNPPQQFYPPPLPPPPYHNSPAPAYAPFPFFHDRQNQSIASAGMERSISTTSSRTVGSNT
ncbi:hypothetical protein EX30DRAFT_160334 [Ascodesmis nigricans]|uniref:Uncharacterized protein n=1 Tax=Ascodesmis nigricans TaxID=341454 RepID=A0A4S2MMS4_9PEZI|nr:hypothetical protein EX30DRAFT_160334 [Ascodesmis nigricans]